MTSHERRRFRRLDVDLPVQLTVENETRKGTLKDISQGGAAVAIQGNAPNVDTHLEIILGEAQSNFHCILPGHVVMVRKNDAIPPDKSYVLHVQFDTLNIEQLHPLALFMSGLLATHDLTGPIRQKSLNENIASRDAALFLETDVDTFFQKLHIENKQNPIALDSIHQQNIGSFGTDVKREVGLDSSLPKGMGHYFRPSRIFLWGILGLGVVGLATLLANRIELSQPKSRILAHDPSVQSSTTKTKMSPLNTDTKPINTDTKPKTSIPTFSDRYIYYTVNSPMNLANVAKKVYFNPDHVGLILVANPSLSSTTQSIPLKTTIKIPRYFDYVVQPGDSLAKIALQFQEDAEDYEFIYEDNKEVLKNPSDLEVGTVLKIALTLPWADDWSEGNTDESDVQDDFFP